MKRHYTLPLYLTFGFVIFLSGCTAIEIKPNMPGEPTSESLEGDFRNEIYSWWGTPYKLGGVSKKGVDCSGFVQMLYKRVYNLPIARATAQQITIGNNVSIQNLQTGDLVFFLNDDVRHVGLYLSNGEFAHASTNHGVRFSNLSERYWASSFFTARRIVSGTTLDEPDVTSAEPRTDFGSVDALPESGTRTSTSKGW